MAVLPNLLVWRWWAAIRGLPHALSRLVSSGTGQITGASDTDIAGHEQAKDLLSAYLNDPRGFEEVLGPNFCLGLFVSLTFVAIAVRAVFSQNGMSGLVSRDEVPHDILRFCST